MKVILSVCVLIACAYAGVLPDELTVHKECMKESGITESELEEARQGHYPEDPKFNNHLLCVAKKIGFVDEDGHIQTETLKEKLGPVINDEAILESVLEKCGDHQHDTPEETASELMKCLYEEKHKHIH